MYENHPDNLRNNPEITGNVYTYLFRILLQNKQKPITNSCRNHIWSKPILILSKMEFKILRKKPGDKAFQVSFSIQISIDFQI